MTVPPLARRLGLEPHPEGGWYRRIWTAPVAVHPAGYPGVRPTATAIHYVLGPGECSAWHRVRSDELWLWQGGGSLALWVADPGEPSDGAGPPPEGGHEHRLGPDDEVSTLVPGGSWQRAEPAADREVLVTCVVSPGFDFADFDLAPGADH